MARFKISHLAGCHDALPTFKHSVAVNEYGANPF